MAKKRKVEELSKAPDDTGVSHAITPQEIMGHPGPLEYLKKSLIQKRLTQAFCFTGPKGIGKETIAKQFIAVDMCAQKPHESFRACGQCEPCRKLARGNHPDFIFVEPETQKIKIDQIRRIMHQAHFRPIAHRRRWVLLNESDCMNENAQNSLLRTLEEPPEDTHFILINHSLERLLPTIRSRCQSIRFAPLKTQEVQAVFQMLGVKSEDMAHLIALSHGSPGHGYQCTQEEIFEIRQEILTILSKSPHISQEGQRRWNFLLLAQKLGGHKNLQPIILEIMQSFYRDLALYQLGIEHAEMANQDFLGEYEPLKNVPLENQWESYAIISQMFSDFRFNTHSELTFNQGFLQLNGTTHEQR